MIVVRLTQAKLQSTIGFLEDRRIWLVIAMKICEVSDMAFIRIML
jgi:hypothetical protein